MLQSPRLSPKSYTTCAHIILKCSKLLIHSKVLTSFLRKHSQSSYNFGRIQSVGDVELSEKKALLYISTDR